ncbi:unnamed protein product [Paramecium pentaurelia]|uniref:AtPDCT1/2 transmembrane domain-containing protein n=1 Tax=Paramecium pentaurelia TaxID=43138 RepID=A0A8S1UUV2_9CILI|nr:unnamed protein product [Paramecium pentaurelia]
MHISNKQSEDLSIYHGSDVQKLQALSKFDYRQSAVPDNPCYNFRFRIFIFFSYIVITQIGEILGTPQDDIKGIFDVGHNYTEGINQLYHSHEWFASLMQVISGLILDFAFFYVSLYWVFYVRNFRLFAALIIFYGIRAIHLNIFKLQFADNYYWKDPGVPTFVVKYGNYSDFFYSGHVGFLVICALEMRKLRKKWFALFFFISSFFQAFIVISFRIHYTIDVPAGYIFAHYFYNQVCYWEIKIDHALYWISTKCSNVKISKSVPQTTKIPDLDTEKQ